MSTSGKYADLVSLATTPRTVTPRELAHAAAQAAQTSLFQRLRREHGGPVAGRLAWMLVRAGQGNHADSEGALDAMAGMPGSTLRSFLRVSIAARDSLRDVGAAALARSIVEALQVTIASAAPPLPSSASGTGNA